MKNEIIELNEENIKDKMHTIRNKKVMLDSDLAEIYGYTIKTFNQQVKNNITTKITKISDNNIFHNMIDKLLLNKNAIII